jgi:hypothetical protein
MEKGDALSCGLARPHGFIGGKPIQVIASHGPGIEPCRCSGNPASWRDLMRRHERRRGAMVVPPEAGLTVKVLSPEKSVIGKGRWYFRDQQATVACAGWRVQGTAPGS